MFCQTGSPAVISVLGAAAFDFVVIDCQHGTTNPYGADLADLIRTCEAAEISAIMRTANADPGQIQRGLDLGVEGIIVPQISTVEQARSAVDAAHYPPLGSRSACPSVRSANYSLMPWNEHRTAADQSTLLFALIESPTGITNLESIAAVPGIAGLFFGAFDLAVASGREPNNPTIQTDRAAVYKACTDNGLLVGDLPWDAEQAQAMASQGAHLLALGIDIDLFACAARTLSAALELHT